ncbi:hypothetical protein N665_0260s0014 [Sinapis alba]|nr:hypothetical protein N665_0260s0014 [Sinapis alba]
MPKRPTALTRRPSRTQAQPPTSKRMVISSQEKSCRSKPLLLLDTSNHNTMEENKQVDASTAKYHPKDEPTNETLTNTSTNTKDKLRDSRGQITSLVTDPEQATQDHRKALFGDYPFASPYRFKHRRIRNLHLEEPTSNNDDRLHRTRSQPPLC